jgi:hypothetical protein
MVTIDDFSALFGVEQLASIASKGKIKSLFNFMI